MRGLHFHFALFQCGAQHRVDRDTDWVERDRRRMQSLLARICGKNAAACKVHATETDCLNNALPSKTSAPTPDPAPTADSSSLIHGERGSPYAAVSRCEVGVSPQTRETRCMHGEPQSQPQPSCAVEYELSIAQELAETRKLVSELHGMQMSALQLSKNGSAEDGDAQPIASTIRASDSDERRARRRERRVQRRQCVDAGTQWQPLDFERRTTVLEVSRVETALAHQRLVTPEVRTRMVCPISCGRSVICCILSAVRLSSGQFGGTVVSPEIW
jgi:hypothetical protein